VSVFATFTVAPLGQPTPNPAWATNTLYTKYFSMVRADSSGVNAYQCIQTGLSASSGSGPTGMGSFIVDNGTVWRYTGPAYVKCFKTSHATGGPGPGGTWPDDGAYAIFSLATSSTIPVSIINPTDLTQQMMTVYGGPTCAPAGGVPDTIYKAGSAQPVISGTYAGMQTQFG